MTRTTDEVIDRFNRAFRERDATLLEDIIAPDCVMESVQPAPDGHPLRGLRRVVQLVGGSHRRHHQPLRGRGRPQRRRVAAHPLALRLGPRPRRLGPWRQRHAGRRRQDRRGRRLLEDRADSRRPGEL